MKTIVIKSTDGSAGNTTITFEGTELRGIDQIVLTCEARGEWRADLRVSPDVIEMYAQADLGKYLAALLERIDDAVVLKRIADAAGWAWALRVREDARKAEQIEEDKP